MSTGKFQDKVVLVTGSGRGFGAVLAQAFADEGAHLVVHYNSSAQGAEAVAAGVRAKGRRAMLVKGDIASLAEVQAMTAAAYAEFGRVDVLVNNAASNIRRKAVDVTPDEWNLHIGVNLTGTFFMSQQMGRHLIAAKRPGSIISISSTHAVIGAVERSTYGVGKAGIVHMARMLAIEWAEYGIRVNTVAPGRLDTESPSRASTSSDPKYMQAMIDKIPLHRLCTVEDVAGAVSYLASDAASYITGQTLMLDGGLTSY